MGLPDFIPARFAHAACRGRRTFARRLSSEAGITLITAVLAMSSLSSAGATVVYFSSSNARSSAYAADQHGAAGLAEAGLNLARSTLWQAPDPSNPSSVPVTIQTVEGVAVTYSGSFDAGSQIWTLTGSVQVPNPTGAAPIVRTASSQVRITSSQQGSTNNAIWNYLYQDDPTFCADISNNVQLKIPVYTRGHLCVANNADLEGSSVQVLGNVEIGNNGSIGKASTITNTPGSLTKPPVDMAAWYSAAAPGPSNACTQGNFPDGFDNDGFMNESRAQVNLAPSTPYDCRVFDQGQLIGQISWVPGQGALPGTLTLAGVIFFDGSVKLNNNANVVYQGKGVIYATGQVLLSNNAKLCGISGCTSSWNPNFDMLVFVAGTTSTDDGFVVRNNGRFQGAAYVEQDFREWNNATVYGPIIARKVRVRNNAVHEFIPFSTLLPGMPASATSTTTLENVEGSFTSS